MLLHGGYGLLGDLELQDDPCRRVAAALGARVVAVDYRLAPESSLDDAVTDTLAVLGHLASPSGTRTSSCPRPAPSPPRARATACRASEVAMRFYLAAAGVGVGRVAASRSSRTWT